MKQRLNLFILSLTLLGLLSCSKVADSELKISVTPNTLNLIDGTWYKCGSLPSDADLASMYFTASKVLFKWESTKNRVVIQQLKITLESPDISGEKSFSLSGDELIAMFQDFESPPGSGAITVDPNLSGTQETKCGLRVGGIKLIDENKTAYISATVRLRGVEIDGSGDSVANVSGETTLNINYEP